jgi:carbonic anhydrase
LVFDAGLGELFVIRVAGNVYLPAVAGSLQYASALLNTPLTVVLGHEGCGAVTAALNSRDQGERHLSRIEFLVNSILPGLPEYDEDLSPKERLAQAVEANVRWTIRQILELREGQAEVSMPVIGAIYRIESGRVEFLK